MLLLVRIGAALHQHVHQLATGGLVRPVVVERIAVVGRLHVGDGHVQRRAPVPIPLVDVGTGLDQALGDVPVGVQHRHRQRRDLRRIAQVHVGLVLQQDLDALAAVLARCIQQRREAATVQRLGAALGRGHALVVAHRAAGVDVGALRRQQLDHLRMPARHRPHQRRLPAEVLARIDLRARLQQQLRRLDVAGARDQVQRRLAIGVGGLRIGTALQQRRDHRRVAAVGGELHRVDAEVVQRAHIGAGLDQSRRFSDVAFESRHLQWRGAIGPDRLVDRAGRCAGGRQQCCSDRSPNESPTCHCFRPR